ncbi:hypothetical protein BJ508DRAFT_347068, partial [Ascobolus immersus RN42]
KSSPLLHLTFASAPRTPPRGLASAVHNPGNPVVQTALNSLLSACKQPFDPALTTTQPTSSLNQLEAQVRPYPNLRPTLTSTAAMLPLILLLALPLLPPTLAYYGFNHHPNDPRLGGMYRYPIRDRHSPGYDSQWEPPHPYGSGYNSESEPPHPFGLLPTGPGALDTPEIREFLASKYQCRRYEWAPKPEECRELLKQIPSDIGCERRMVFRSEDRPSAEGGGGVGGCEIAIFDSNPDKGCWSRTDIVRIVEGLINECEYDDDYGSTHPAMAVMGSYWDTAEFTDEVRWKVLTVQPAGVGLFNEERFWGFPQNGGVFLPDAEDVLVVGAESPVVDVASGLEADAAYAVREAEVVEEVEVQVAVPAFGEHHRPPVVVGTLPIKGGDKMPTKVGERASRVASVAASKVSNFVATVEPKAWGGVVVVTGEAGKEAQATHVGWKLTDELNVFMGEPVVEEPVWTQEVVVRQGALEGYH